jgi:hypothetical protein
MTAFPVSGGAGTFDPSIWPAILAGLQDRKLSEIMAAAGVSKGFASNVRRGDYRPHPSTWPALARLAGLSHPGLTIDPMKVAAPRSPRLTERSTSAAPPTHERGSVSPDSSLTSSGDASSDPAPWSGCTAGLLAPLSSPGQAN